MELLVRRSALLAGAFLAAAALSGQPEPGPVLGLWTAADGEGSFREESRRGAEVALDDARGCALLRGTVLRGAVLRQAQPGKRRLYFAGPGCIIILGKVIEA